MISQKNFFKNLFDDKSITIVRLYLFGTMVLARLIKANDKGQYFAIINALTAALAALKKELTDADINLTDQKNSTSSVEEVMYSFGRYMSDNEPFIARALGGRHTAAYLSFFPFKISEYLKATKGEMPVLTTRVKEAAVKYATDLGTILAAGLQGFDGAYTTAFNNQQEQIGVVQNDRGGRSKAFAALQLELTAAMHGVGQLNPGNVAVCSAIFPFAVLFTQKKITHYILKGSLLQNTTALVLNRTLTKNVAIELTNKSLAAGIALWLAPNAEAPVPAIVYEVGANEKRSFKAGDLGDLAANPFVMIKNLSTVNEAVYEADFLGLKKEVKGAAVKVEKAKDMEIVKDEDVEAA